MSATILVGQAPTVLGPLTTTFTPPAACTVGVGSVDAGLLGLGLLGGSAANIAYLGQTCVRGKAVDATSCWPPTSSGAEAKSAPLGGWGYYSPGLHCPIGYATACSATGGSGGASGWPVQFKLLDGETAVGCCPSGYGCANINGQTCTVVATSTMVQTVTCEGTEMGDFAVQTVPDPAASITAFSLFAPMIQINWQSSDTTTETSATAGPTTTPEPGAAATGAASNGTATDRPPTASGTKTVNTGVASGVSTLETDGLLPPATGTGSSTASNSGTGAARPPSDAEQTADPSSGSGGLATGTKVGLGIGGGIAAVVLVVSVLIFAWRRRNSRREDQELDRLYGLKHGSSSDLTGANEIPGWYRGQRLLTPTADPFRGPGTQLEPPPSPYYRPYRP
ncbi:hypothetical protein B0T24DRAFT_517498 [Lasiosphaeria ovina]|uniref:Uncharacterized protein n=1 Tax=Lasiosphaeria ovina TaxID=92902 RepID=A0AAE0NIH5_9PEZI|nr:hypothetical protein B0T24DRAFT_517498 [Lasiosphaeria ovina]